MTTCTTVHTCTCNEHAHRHVNVHACTGTNTDIHMYTHPLHLDINTYIVDKATNSQLTSRSVTLDTDDVIAHWCGCGREYSRTRT